MPTFRYAGYPDAKVYDAVDGKQVNHLLFCDWIRLEGDAADGWVPVHVRGLNDHRHRVDAVGGPE